MGAVGVQQRVEGHILPLVVALLPLELCCHFASEEDLHHWAVLVVQLVVQLADLVVVVALVVYFLPLVRQDMAASVVAKEVEHWNDHLGQHRPVHPMLQHN